MKYLFAFLSLGFLAGQVVSITFANGIRLSLLDVAVALSVGSLLIMQPSPKQLATYNKVFLPFLGVGFLSLVLQLFSLPFLQILDASLYLLRFFIYSLLFLVALQHKKLVLPTLWWSGIGLAVLGIGQYFLYPNLRNLAYLGWDPHENRLFSTLLDPNFTGIVLVLTFFLAVYFWFSKQGRRPILIFGIVVSFLALLLTYSRGSFVAFVIGLVTLAFLYKKYAVLLGGTLILLFGIILLPGGSGEGVHLLRSSTINSRLENAAEAIGLISKRPLFGYGYNTLRFIRGKTSLEEGTISLSHSGAGFHASILFILATTGVVGLLAYGNIWWQLHTQSNSRKNFHLHAFWLISMITVGAHSLFDNSLFYPQVLVWMWGISGLVIGIPKPSKGGQASSG